MWKILLISDAIVIFKFNKFEDVKNVTYFLRYNNLQV